MSYTHKDIDVNKLYISVLEQHKRKLNTYNSVLEKCYLRIKRYTENYQLRCLYEIPTFIIGTPIYDYEELKTYIINNLKKKGFKVLIFNNTTIYISWDLKNKKVNNNKKTINYKKVSEFTPITEIYNNDLAIKNIEKKNNLINIINL